MDKLEIVHKLVMALGQVVVGLMLFIVLLHQQQITF
jgi:hypothetical protein